MLIGLEYLRCIGTLLVLRAHLTLDLVGYYFLDIFFIISAFVMAMLITKPQLPQDKFVKDRMTRAFPFYWTLTLGLFLLAILHPALIGESASHPLSLFKSLCFIPYYNHAGIINPILPVAWTMNYEILLYTFCCLSFAVSVRWRVPFVIAGLMLVHVLGVMAWRHGGGAPAEFYAGHYIYDFPMGMLLWLGYARYRKQGMLRPDVAVLVVLACLAFMFIAEQRWKHEVSWLWLYTLPATLMIWAVLSLEKHMPAGWLTRFACRIGEASFSIYLTHVFVIKLVHLAMAQLGLESNAFSQILLYVLCIWIGLQVDRHYDKPLSRLFRRWLGRLPPFGRVVGVKASA